MAQATDMGTSSAGNREIQFCSYCGTKLDKGAKFCKGCGKPIGQPTQSREFVKDNPITERKTVYEGYIHKCPSCGEVLDAFVTNCPSCGYEIRDAQSASSVREFAMKLERIEAQKMPAFEEKKSIMKIVFGKDFKDTDEAKEAKANFEKQKNQEKANIIINYSVPNTKEDILEFILLAASNIDTKHRLDDVVTKAWIAKLDQVYQKAEISMGTHPGFEQIRYIYEKKHSQIKNKKLLSVLGWVGGVAAWFFLYGLLLDSTLTISIAVGVAVLLLIGFIIFRKR